MERDRLMLGYIVRLREIVKEYAQLEKGRLHGDDWSEDNPTIRLRKEINKLVLPVKAALEEIGLSFSVALFKRGRRSDIDLASDLFDLPDHEAFEGWGTVFDLLERAIGIYELRIDNAVAQEVARRRRDDTAGLKILDEALQTRCLPLLQSLRSGEENAGLAGADTKLDMIVREMSVILEDRIRKEAGLENVRLEGASLLTRAFGGQSPVLRFSEDPAVQESAHLLYRGFSGFVRNEVMHKLVPTYDEQRVLQLLGLVDYLLFLLHRAKRA